MCSLRTISLPVLVAAATVASVGCSGGSPNDLPVAIVHRRDHKGFPLGRNQKSEIRNPKSEIIHPTSCLKTRTTSSEPAAKAAQLLQSLRKVTAAKFCEPFNRVRDLFVD